MVAAKSLKGTGSACLRTQAMLTLLYLHSRTRSAAWQICSGAWPTKT